MCSPAPKQTPNKRRTAHRLQCRSAKSRPHKKISKPIAKSTETKAIDAKKELVTKMNFAEQTQFPKTPAAAIEALCISRKIARSQGRHTPPPGARGYPADARDSIGAASPRRPTILSVSPESLPRSAPEHNAILVNSRFSIARSFGPGGALGPAIGIGASRLALLLAWTGNMATPSASQQREILYALLSLEFGRRMADRWASENGATENGFPTPEGLLISFLGKSATGAISRFVPPGNE